MQRYALFSPEGLPVAFFAEDIHGPLKLPIYGDAPEPAEDVPAPVAPVIGHEDNPAYPAGIWPISDTEWKAMIRAPESLRWDAAAKALVAHTPPPPPPQVPDQVFDYQFAGQAAAEGIISFAEAMAWTARGEIPPVLVAAVDEAVTDADRRMAVMLFLAGSKTYPRHHALTPLLGPLLGKADDAALDAFWIAAAAR